MQTIRTSVNPSLLIRAQHFFLMLSGDQHTPSSEPALCLPQPSCRSGHTASLPLWSSSSDLFVVKELPGGRSCLEEENLACRKMIILSESPCWNCFDLMKLTFTCRRQSRGHQTRNRDPAVSLNDRGKSFNLSELPFFLTVTWDNKMDFCGIKWDHLLYGVLWVVKCYIMSGVTVLGGVFMSIRLRILCIGNFGLKCIGFQWVNG